MQSLGLQFKKMVKNKTKQKQHCMSKNVLICQSIHIQLGNSLPLLRLQRFEKHWTAFYPCKCLPRRIASITSTFINDKFLITSLKFCRY